MDVLTTIPRVRDAFGKDSFQLSSCIPFIRSTHDYEELLAYFAEWVTQLERKLVATHDSIVKYWLTRREAFRFLSKVALKNFDSAGVFVFK